VEEVLKDDAFVAKHVGDDVPERKILYEDPDLGFCILAHVYHGAKESAPHDHGPTWAIYGQAAGETLMNEWAMVEPASEQKPGKVRHVRAYPLKRGMAHVYNEGDLHSRSREGSTRLIRIEAGTWTRSSASPTRKPSLVATQRPLTQPSPSPRERDLFDPRPRRGRGPQFELSKRSCEARAE